MSQRSGLRVGAEPVAKAAPGGGVAGAVALRETTGDGSGVRVVDIAAVLELRAHLVDVQHDTADRRETALVGDTGVGVAALWFQRGYLRAQQRRKLLTFDGLGAAD